MSRPMYGLRAWILQRISALYLAAFIVYVLLRFALDAPSDYESWRHWVGQPHVSALTAVFFIMLFAHAWVGARDVILDYAPNLILRSALLIGLLLALLFCAVWVARILMVATLV